jgi:transglutaminase-like putative cysteine protease
MPVEWIIHARLSVAATAIGRGISALPRNSVPSSATDPSVRLVMVLAPAVLLLDAAVLLAFASGALRQWRTVAVLLPLVALLAIPTTMLPPKFAYADGLLVFTLIAAFLWGDRIEPGHRAAAVGLCGLGAVTAMVLAPAIDPGKPLLNYRGIGATGPPQAIETFDWEQGYGPIDWPRRGRLVLQVKAQHADYWKAEDLDIFDGRGWAQGVVAGSQSLPPGPPAAINRWQQRIEVKLGDMRTSDVIGSGFSSPPADVPQPVIGGFSPGTWTATGNLGPGDTYAVRVYAPHPSATELKLSPPRYTGVPPGYRTILLPASALGRDGARPGLSQAEVEFPPFHSRQPVVSLIGVPLLIGPKIIEHSPYARAYALARRVERSSATPYAFARSIQRLLAHGYKYNEDPPVSRYPLESFLFTSKLGYCQQFAGAMALLLRMGGVPARVAVGFTPGTYNPATGRWLVTDVDAHAWVEAWFNGYGWIRFDPTPAADPALTHLPSLSALGAISGTLPTKPHATRQPDTGASGSGASKRGQPGNGSNGLLVAEFAVLALLAAAVVVAVALATRPLRTPELVIDELERAFSRTGRPLPTGVTLSALERRFRSSPGAASYIRSLRLERFGGAPSASSSGQRRALRDELASGLGALGWLRALWALPPRRH